MHFSSYILFLIGMVLFVEGLIHIGDSVGIVSNLGNIIILIIGSAVSYASFLPSKG